MFVRMRVLDLQLGGLYIIFNRLTVPNVCNVIPQVLNRDAGAKRAAEEDVYRMALGKDISFEEYLNTDKDFNKAMAEKKKGI